MIPLHVLFRPTQPPSFRTADVRRLSPHLRSSGALCQVLKEDTISTDDLRRMLFMEVNPAPGDPRPRPVIVRKLVGRILSRERTRMVKLVIGE